MLCIVYNFLGFLGYCQTCIMRAMVLQSSPLITNQHAWPCCSLLSHQAIDVIEPALCCQASSAAQQHMLRTLWTMRATQPGRKADWVAAVLSINFNSTNCPEFINRAFETKWFYGKQHRNTREKDWYSVHLYCELLFLHSLAGV